MCGDQIEVNERGTRILSASCVGADLVAAAINHGYRLIDTAEFYHNEEGVGLGLQKSGTKREEMFVVSKWWPSREGASGALKSLNHCLNRSLR